MNSGIRNFQMLDNHNLSNLNIGSLVYNLCTCPPLTGENESTSSSSHETEYLSLNPRVQSGSASKFCPL